jgi:hypothetical protein
MEIEMANIHTPERQPGEDFAAYKERRAQSNAINRANRQIGRGGVSSRQQLRDSMRASGAMGKKTRAYVALTAAWASKVVPKWEGPRDEHGAYTVVGKDAVYADASGRAMRRKWLGGISAQRGY